MTLRKRLAVSLLLCATASKAQACTVCSSPNGVALRAALFHGHFLHTLLLVFAPVPVFVVAIALLHLAMPDISPAAPPSGTLAMLHREWAA